MGGKHAVTAAVLACLALALAPLALAGPGGISPPDPKTDSGEAISELYWFVFAITAFVFVVVETSLVLFIVRYRRRPTTPEDAEGPQIHGNTRIEVIWTIVPALILVGIAAVVLARVPAVQADEGSDGGGITVRVEAHQFYWQYVYENGVVSLDRLVLPVDTHVTLELISYDVDHSWWVPELTGKLDAIPGQKNTLEFQPNEEGTYEGQCAEHCGIQHAVMRTDVDVVPGAEFDEWLSSQEAAQGRADPGFGGTIFAAACAKCHGEEGEGDIGPEIAGNATLQDRGGLIRLLREGQDTPALAGFMPRVGRGWPDAQYDALIAYVKSVPKLAGGGNGSGG
ncbi:MAG: cytochrome c oxidase subunit II [Gaiellaceae bacterium]